MSVGLNFYNAMTVNTEAAPATSVSNLSPHHSTSSIITTCVTCHRTKAARTHHCWLCNVCVVKRDHHCFFMGTCIGQQNQKYFIVYCFYQFIAGLYYVVLSALYLFKRFGFRFTFVKFVSLPFIIIYQTILNPGSTDMYFSVCVGVMYGTLVAMLVGVCFFVWQMFLVVEGLTSFEARHTGEPAVDNENMTVAENIYDVFPGGVLKYFINPFTRPSKSLTMRQSADGTKSYSTKGKGKSSNKIR